MADSDPSSASPPSRGLILGAKWAFLAYATAWLLVLLPMAFDDEDYAALVGLPIIVAWLSGPAFAACFFVKASRTRAGQLTFLAVQYAIFVSMAVAAVDAFLISEDPQAPLGLMAFAFFQYCALPVLAFLATLAGWRARDGWR
ncbi:MAG TPA: hypothetical protein VK472_03455 [Allosphingosinicella sp.]|nr:hypothetical protein [Allosphingosinicella sp.]